MTKKEKTDLLFAVAMTIREAREIKEQDFREEKKLLGLKFDMNSYASGFDKGEISALLEIEDSIHEMINDLDI